MSREKQNASPPTVLLLNPPIHDFAAYDFWAKPLGLLVLGGWLRKMGAKVSLLDLTDPLSIHLSADMKPSRKPGGHGRFHREQIPRSAALPYIGRRYSRYGLPPQAALPALARQPKPQAVLVTSMMTYWYPGVVEAIGWSRQVWPEAPVLLGGVYATLCTDHAEKHSGADRILPGPALQSLSYLAEILRLPTIDAGIDPPLPAHDLYANADSAALATSAGCPYSCDYCGVKALGPNFIKHPLIRVKREIERIVLELGLTNIAIYDDAFIADEKRALAILRHFADLGKPVNLHFASGLSCRGITGEIAKALKAAGGATIRIGLETVDERQQRKLGDKVRTEEFQQAVKNLLAAGFKEAQIGAYVMAGLPDQRLEEVERSVEAVRAMGITPRIAEFSPVPQSPLFDRAALVSKYDLTEPLFHNPTLLPCAGSEITQAALQQLRSRINNQS